MSLVHAPPVEVVVVVSAFIQRNEEVCAAVAVGEGEAGGGHFGAGGFYVGGE